MMSSLKVNQIRAKLRSMFEADLDLSDIGAMDPDRDTKVLSRCLAALAVYLQTECTEKEAAGGWPAQKFLSVYTLEGAPSYLLSLGRGSCKMPHPSKTGSGAARSRVGPMQSV